MAGMTFSLEAGIRKGLLLDEIRSAIDIAAASCSGLFTTVPAVGEQMAMGLQKVLRLQAPGVMQGLQELR